MRGRYVISILSFISLLIIAGCNNQVQTQTKALTTGEILQQSIDKMKALPGSTRDVTETMVNPNVSAKILKAKHHLELKDATHFYLKSQYAYDDKRPYTKEFYRDNDQVYLYDSMFTGDWLQVSRIGADAAKLYADTKLLDPYNYHFVYTLERMKELEKQVTKHESKNAYLLEIHLKQASQMKDFLLPFVEINHLEEDPFYVLDLKVWIDKQSKQVTKVEEHKQYNRLFLRIEQTSTTVFTGLTKQITKPQGTQNAKIQATYPTQ